VSKKSQVKVYLPEELHDLLNADSRSNSEAVEAALWAEYGGEKEAAIDRRIEEKESRISLLTSERNERDREIDEEKKELKALKSKKENLGPDVEQHWKDAVGNIHPTNAAKQMSTYDAETWAPRVDNEKVQIYADRLGITPEEFVEKFPAKRREYDAF